MVVICVGCTPAVKQTKVVVRQQPILYTHGEVSMTQVSVRDVLTASSHESFYPDPFLGKIENTSDHVFIDIWVNPTKDAFRMDPNTWEEETTLLPNFTLAPRMVENIKLPLGVHYIYARGTMRTADGPIYLGATNEEIEVDTEVSYGGHYGWELSFGKDDFPFR